MAEKIVVVINGYARAGKDAVSNFVIEEAVKRWNWRGHSISSIDPIRNMLASLGVPVERKTPAERDLLAEVKSALDKYDGYATKLCAREVQTWLDEMPFRNSICFAHMREVAAIQRFKQLMSPYVAVVTLLVTGPREERVMSNVADADVGNLSYDRIIRNDGSLDDLRLKCAAFAHELMKETEA